MTKKKTLTIAHLSDLHVGSQYFVPNLLQRTLVEINELEPDAVVITGDLTDMGLEQHYKSFMNYLKVLKCPNILIIPGNHDARNVGYLHFEELIGSRHSVVEIDDIIIAGADSSEPDLNSGRIGREMYGWLAEVFAPEKRAKIFCVHHHLIPVPGTGRERNIVDDAGDLLELLIDLGVQIVLVGHKHVPYAWHLESLVLINAGTVCTMRLRGKTKPCYNILTLDQQRVRVYRKYPFGNQEMIVDFSLEGTNYCKWIPRSTGMTFPKLVESRVQAEGRIKPEKGSGLI